MATLNYYLARHYIGGMLGWGPTYALVVVQEHAAKGLQQVSRRDYSGAEALFKSRQLALCKPAICAHMYMGMLLI